MVVNLVMKAIRDSIPLAPSDTAKAQLTEKLSQLYANYESYPSDSMLHEWELTQIEAEPFSSGGFGDCRRALFLGRHPVVMKCSRSNVTDEEATRRAKREMKVWSELRHPNILPFIGYITLGSPSRLFMVSPWMKNQDLSKYLKAHPSADRLLLLVQIAAGLEYLHTSDPIVVHGDLRAVNILVSETGKPCIGDFGLSENIIEGTGNSTNRGWTSSAFKYGGNPRWQAPELFDDPRRTRSSDVFAFGRVIYEAYTGLVPFANIHPPGIYVAVLRGKLPWRPDGFDNHMWQFMAQCCNNDPNKRPSAQGIARYLRSDHTAWGWFSLYSLIADKLVLTILPREVEQAHTGGTSSPSFISG